MTLKVVNELKIHGEKYSWFAGTKVWFRPRSKNQLDTSHFAIQDETANFDAECCTNIKVVFFKPKKPDRHYNSTNSTHGVIAIPGIEAAFYMDLSARAIDAVKSMKKYVFRNHKILKDLIKILKLKFTS